MGKEALLGFLLCAGGSELEATSKPGLLVGDRSLTEEDWSLVAGRVVISYSVPPLLATNFPMFNLNLQWARVGSNGFSHKRGNGPSVSGLAQGADLNSACDLAQHTGPASPSKEDTLASNPSHGIPASIVAKKLKNRSFVEVVHLLHPTEVFPHSLR